MRNASRGYEQATSTVYEPFTVTRRGGRAQGSPNGTNARLSFHIYYPACCTAGPVMHTSYYKTYAPLDQPCTSSGDEPVLTVSRSIYVASSSSELLGNVGVGTETLLAGREPLLAERTFLLAIFLLEVVVGGRAFNHWSSSTE